MRLLFPFPFPLTAGKAEADDEEEDDEDEDDDEVFCDEQGKQHSKRWKIPQYVKAAEQLHETRINRTCLGIVRGRQQWLRPIESIRVGKLGILRAGTCRWSK